MFGFIFLHISCPSPYKRCANLSLWNPHVSSTDSMMNLKKRWTKNIQENENKHLINKLACWYGSGSQFGWKMNPTLPILLEINVKLVFMVWGIDK